MEKNAYKRIIHLNPLFLGFYPNLLALILSLFRFPSFLESFIIPFPILT